MKEDLKKRERDRGSRRRKRKTKKDRRRGREKQREEEEQQKQQLESVRKKELEEKRKQEEEEEQEALQRRMIEEQRQRMLLEEKELEKNKQREQIHTPNQQEDHDNHTESEENQSTHSTPRSDSEDTGDDEIEVARAHKEVKNVGKQILNKHVVTPTIRRSNSSRTPSLDTLPEDNITPKHKISVPKIPIGKVSQPEQPIRRLSSQSQRAINSSSPTSSTSSLSSRNRFPSVSKNNIEASRGHRGSMTARPSRNSVSQYTPEKPRTSSISSMLSPRDLTRRLSQSMSNSVPLTRSRGASISTEKKEDIGVSFIPLDEDVEIVIELIIEKHNVSIPPHKIHEYSEILKSNLVYKLSDISDLDSESWMMIVNTSGFPVRLRQLLINECNKSIEEEKNLSNANNNDNEENGVIGSIASFIKQKITNEDEDREKGILKFVSRKISFTGDVDDIYDEKRDLELFFKVSKLSHMRGHIELDEDSACVLCSLRAQAQLGDISELQGNIQVILSNEETQFFPHQYQPVDDVVLTKAINLYTSLSSISKDEAKLRFYKAWLSIPDNNKEFIVRFDVLDKRSDSRSSDSGSDSKQSDEDDDDEGSDEDDDDNQWVLGVSPASIYRMSNEDGTEAIDISWNFNKLKRWKHDQESQVYTLEFNEEYAPVEFIIDTDLGITLSQLLSVYTERLMNQQQQQTQQQQPSMLQRNNSDSSSSNLKGSNFTRRMSLALNSVMTPRGGTSNPIPPSPQTSSSIQPTPREDNKILSLEVKLPHQNDTTFYSVRDSDTVENVCLLIARHLNLETDGRYGLRLENWARYQFLPYNKSLNAINASENLLLLRNVLVLSTRLFVNTPLLNPTNIEYISFHFHESKQEIVEGNWFCERNVAIKLASLQLQFEYNNFNPEIHTMNFMEKQLPKYLPKQYQKSLNVVPEILSHYNLLADTPKIVAGTQYIELTRKLTCFGQALFYVTIENQFGMLGVNHHSVKRLNTNNESFNLNNSVLESWPLSTIISKKATKDRLEIIFDQFVLLCDTPDATIINQLIEDYTKLSNNSKADDTKCVVM
eukprot:TRINITY_DN2102_c0_g3_i3.p1 TRINITY_DN2102_c0_g3~~TRINITY_DN2102_c0_g3_i3.p1  ORF type:complete len:1054 (-),score=324.98 TRINITY_DN2102_c0_g3_i3:1048-4209(-)